MTPERSVDAGEHWIGAEVPVVSVIIPAYNADRTIGPALDSVLAQTFEDLEVVVVNDGSSDATAEEVARRGTSRVRCVTTPNGGVASARNHGLAMSRGEYVAFLDADDVWRPTKLARQLAVMREQPDVGVCFTAAERVDDRLQPIAADPALPRSDYCAALVAEGNIVPGGGSSVMARQSVLSETGGFDTRLSQCADWDLWLRMSLVTPFARIDDPLVLYRAGTGTMSSDPGLLERDTFALLDKFFGGDYSEPYRGLRRRAYGRQWMVCAGSYLQAGQRRDALRCVGRGLRADPRSLQRPLSLPARRAARLWSRPKD